MYKKYKAKISNWEFNEKKRKMHVKREYEYDTLEEAIEKTKHHKGHKKYYNWLGELVHVEEEILETLEEILERFEY